MTYSLQYILGGTLSAFLAAMYGIAIYANRQVKSTEDFLVAGRRLPLSLAWLTLLATWFGAGTLLTVSDEVRDVGIQAAALDPLGAGACLLFVGCFVAGPMWRMQLLTVPDFFERKFGKTSELLTALILVPSYLGWIAVQYLALAEMLEILFQLPSVHGLWLVALVGTGYTLLGGMWSVTLTDALQIAALAVGLLLLTVATLAELGGVSGILGGWQALRTDVPPDHWVVVPREDAQALFGWLGVFLTGALGNVPVQDLMQRVFASNSEATARRACWLAGTAYLTLGMLPILLALASTVLLRSDVKGSVITVMATQYLSPSLAIVFSVTLLSAVLSTIDSALLSPASVLAQNVLPRMGIKPTLLSNRTAVVVISLASLAIAYVGEDAYGLLEESYAITLVGLFVPLMFGLFLRTPPREAAALAAIAVGSGLWLLHFVMGWDSFFQPWLSTNVWPVPTNLTATLAAAIAFAGVNRVAVR